jgi:hypothetical protein
MTTPTAKTVQDELTSALRVAEQWINLLVKEMDIEPSETTVTISAKTLGVTGSGRDLAKINLAQFQQQIRDALASVQS